MSPVPRRQPSRHERPAELTAYLRRLRKLRSYYAAALLVVGALVVAGVLAAYRGGELSHTIVHSARAGIAAPALTPVQADLTSVWSVDQASATGQPVQGGIVVTHTADTVYGRSATTGAVVWSYARTDGVICAVTDVSGKTLVLFRRHRDCDELNAVDTATGARVWQRSLTTDSTFVTGQASMRADTDAVDVITATSITKVSVSSEDCDSAQGENCGLDYWFYTPDPGCQVNGYVPGALGDLISERCAAGSQLVLHDRYSGTGSAAIRWKVPETSSLSPASASAVVSAIDTSPAQLVVFNAATGAVTSRAALTPRPPTRVVSAPVALAGGDEVFCSGQQCYSVTATGTVAAWTRTTLTPPALSPDHLLYAVTEAGLVSVASVASGGTVLRRWSLPATDTVGEQVFRVAAGFVLFGSHTAFVSSIAA